MVTEMENDVEIQSGSVLSLRKASSSAGRIWGVNKLHSKRAPILLHVQHILGLEGVEKIED